jgi:hypothetical protein
MFPVSKLVSLGREATIFPQKLSALLAAKWEKPYSHVCGYVNARISIAIVRATHLCLRGYSPRRIPTSKMSRLPQWEDTSGLSIFRH